MTKAALLQAIQGVMSAQFDVGFKAGVLSEVVNALHPDPHQVPNAEPIPQPVKRSRKK